MISRWLAACGIALTALLAFGAAPLAQGVQTGAIRGIVRDDQRGPIPTVTVTLTSVVLQGARTTIPREDGSYGFWQLPPGDYEIRFEAPRFVSVTRTVAVLHGLDTELNVTLREESAPQQREEVAETPAPVAGPPVASHFTHDEIDRLAVPRTLTGISGLAAPAADLFLLNGVDVTDNVLDSPQNLFVEDAVDTTAVVTAGAPSDYGRFTGSLVHAVTRSGGNRFSGSYRANLSNPKWSAQTPFELCDPAVTAAACQKANTAPDEIHAWHEGTLGGFLVKDRIWFFTAGRLEDTSRTTTLPLSGVDNTETSRNQRGQIKITAAPLPRHTLTFDAATNLTTNDGHPAFAYTVDPGAVGKRTFPNFYYSTGYRAAVGKRVLVEGQFSTRDAEHREIGAVSTAIIDSPIITKTGSPAHYNAPYFDAGDNEKRNNVQGTGNVTYLMTTRAGGRHEINGGYEFFRSQHAGGGSQSATGYVYETNYLTARDGRTPVLDASGRFIPLWVPGETLLENWLPTRGARLNVDTQSIYLQDRWTIGRVSADIGMRHERVRSDATNVFTGVDARTNLPRLSVAYTADERGRHVARVTYGRYAARFDEVQLGRNTAVGNPDLWQAVYFGPLGQGRSFAAGFDPTNYLTLAGRFPTANVSIDGDLQPPLVKELTASYGVGVNRGFVQAAFVSRRWSRFVDDFISIANGTTHVVRKGFDVGTFTNITYRNTDAASRVYDALEFQGRFQPRSRWTVHGNYTVQLRNEGNALAGDDPAGTTTALGNYPEIFSEDRHDPAGRLSTFQRSRLRVWSIYDLDLGRAGALSLSGLVRVESGRVYSLAANVPLTPIQTARLVDAGYPDRPASQTVFFGNRGSQMFPGYGVLDLALGYNIPLFASTRPWLKVEIYNALDNGKLISWNTAVVPDSASAADALGLPTSYRAAGGFGKATSSADFAVPFAGTTGGRTFQLALGFRF